MISPLDEEGALVDGDRGDLHGGIGLGAGPATTERGGGEEEDDGPWSEGTAIEPMQRLQDENGGRRQTRGNWSTIWLSGKGGKQGKLRGIVLALKSQSKSVPARLWWLSPRQSGRCGGRGQAVGRVASNPPRVAREGESVARTQQVVWRHTGREMSVAEFVLVDVGKRRYTENFHWMIDDL